MSEPLFVEAETVANLHSHEREGDKIMKALIEKCAEGGADVLGLQPNTNEGLTTAEKVLEYLSLAEDFAEESKVTMRFIPFVMLTERTTESEIAECIEAGIVDGKMLPFMRTTKSTKGVKEWGRMLPVVKWCDKHGMKVHGHFEHPNMGYSDRDAELMCLPIAEMFLQETVETGIFWEHGSDARCIPHWKDFARSGRFFLTITAHHPATNEDKARRDVRAECKPTIKTESDRLGLVQLISEDHPWVMAGADDAPHPEHAKHVHEGQCACGAYTSPFLLPLYAHALDDLLQSPKGLEIFVNFTSRNARKVHNLPPASKKITLSRTPLRIPRSYGIGPWIVEPFWAGKEINWSFAPTLG